MVQITWSNGHLESNFDMCGEIKAYHFKDQEDSPDELFKVWASSIVVLLKAFPEKGKETWECGLIEVGELIRRQPQSFVIPENSKKFNCHLKRALIKLPIALLNEAQNNRYLKMNWWRGFYWKEDVFQPGPELNSRSLIFDFFYHLGSQYGLW